MRDSRVSGERFQFYEIVEFPYAGHWLLGLPDEDHFSEFADLCVRGERITGLRSKHPLPLKVLTPGKPMDVSFTPIGLIPIVSHRAVEVLKKAAPEDLQFFPATIEGVKRGYAAMNVARRICVNVHRSGFSPYPDEHGLRRIIRVVIDPTRVGNSQIFRLETRPIILIFSDQLRKNLDDAGIIGPGLTGVETAPA
jgi:hypothetical protein